MSMAKGKRQGVKNGKRKYNMTEGQKPQVSSATNHYIDQLIKAYISHLDRIFKVE